MTRRGSLDTPDGINIFIFSLAQGFLLAGHDVTVVGATLGDQAKLESMYRMRRYPNFVALGRTDATYGRISGARLFFARHAIDRLRPDLIIINGAVPFSFRSRSCTVVHDAERRLTRFGFQAAYKRFSYARSTLLVATCSEVRQAISSELGVDETAIGVIPTCVDLTAYRAAPLGNREDAILHVGTAAYKNPLATIRAFRLLLSAKATLYLTGKPDEPVKAALESLEPEVRARVHLLGIVPADTLRKLLSEVRIVSVPSRYFAAVASPTVIEAFASGTPVVALDGVSSDLLQDHVSGFACSDETEMSERFADLFGDDALWLRMSAAALATAQRFSAAVVAGSYLRLARGDSSRSNG